MSHAINSLLHKFWEWRHNYLIYTTDLYWWGSFAASCTILQFLVHSKMNLDSNHRISIEGLSGHRAAWGYNAKFIYSILWGQQTTLLLLFVIFRKFHRSRKHVFLTWAPSRKSPWLMFIQHNAILKITWALKESRNKIKLD